MTLPQEAIDALLDLNADLGWAIVSLVEKSRGAVGRPALQPPELELVDTGDGHQLIVVSTAILRSLPGIQLVPISSTQAFLALQSGSGLAELELAIVDRLERPISERERKSLGRVRDQLRKWRRDPHLEFQTRSIILVSRRP